MNKVTCIKNKNYTTISNVFMRDKNLSLKAKGFLALVMTLPNDWDFTINGIAKIIKEGKSAIYSTIDELKEQGYCNVIIVRNDKGVILGNNYSFFEEPHKEEPYLENPNMDNQTQINKEVKEVCNKQNKDKEKELKEKFSAFVFSYKKAGGKVRGVETEFNDFTKRHKDWKQVIPYLEMALQREIKARNTAKLNKHFFPEMKMLQTYLGKQRAWELYVTIGEKIESEVYTPSGNYSLMWDEPSNAYMYIGYYYDGMEVADGYTNDNRPNGAKIILNNARGTIIWNSQTKKWEHDRD